MAPGRDPTPPTRPTRSFRWRRLLIAVSGGMGLIALSCASMLVCLPAWVRWGLVLDECPAGRPAATAWLDGSSLRRGQWRTLNVGATAHYSPGPADTAWTTEVRYPGVALALVSPDGTETELEPRKRWKRSWSGSRQGEVMLPADLPDGDYLLRARVDSRLGEVTADAPLPLYAPARLHVLTDRPLYEPGNQVQFRAVALRAADLSPLSGRPGTWVVMDPSGTVLLEERAAADDWGVVSGSFPLDRLAQSGDWTVRWDSGGASSQAVIRVEPFTLPRFQVQAQADRPWYGPGDSPVITGRVKYASGAPVPQASLSMRWRADGAWPPPTAWTDGSPGGLPTQATTDSSGAFRLALPPVPADLLGQATLSAVVDAVDPAGDRVQGALSLLLSQDRIQVQAVTELGEGLVEDANNRVYLRATTAAGAPLLGVDLRVRRAWDPTDEGELARTDQDGVAALQISPGPAVSVIVPAQPVRPPPRVAGLRSPQVQDLMERRTVALVDQRAIDGWTAALEPCARFEDGHRGHASLVLRVASTGALEPFAPDGAVARCLASAVAGRRLPPGDERLLRVSWTVQDPELPRLSTTARGWPDLPGPLSAQVAQAALDARACLPEDAGATALPRRLELRTRPDATEVTTRWLPRGPTTLPAAAVACVEGRLSGFRLPEPADQATIGLVDLDLEPAARTRRARPEPTTMLGYELHVQALAGAEDLGSTVLRLAPGAVPSVRLRATPILPEKGATVQVELLRGPDFQGELPEKLVMRHQGGKSVVADLDPKTRQATFDLPDELEGWFTVEWGEGVARAFVRPQGELAIDLTSDRTTYAPGETATLTVRTTQGGQGAPAAVGLLGVDESLGQLVPLPGPDALQVLRDPVLTPSPAFGALDGQALSLGRIQGEHAAAATVLRVGQLPTPADTDADVPVYHQGSFDPVLPLSERFYPLLAELHAQVRAWEATAPAGTLMDNPTMAGLWRDAREACQARGEDVSDAYGRPLRLHWLPEELLQLTDPRVVVIDSTRLPEDVVAWSPWVAEEEPR